MDIFTIVSAPSPPARCPGCGVTLWAGEVYCHACGRQLQAVPGRPPVPHHHPTSPSAPHSAPEKRAPVALIVVSIVAAVVLAATGGVAGFLLLGGTGGEDTSPTPAPTTTLARHQPTGVAPGSSSTPSVPVAQCWDGTTAAAVSDCPLPAGPAGAQWIFTGLDIQQCHAGRGRVVDLNCSHPDFPGVRFHVSKFASTQQGIDHYRAGRDVAEERVGDVIRWTSYTYGGNYKLAQMYPDQPWAVSIYATSPGQRAKAIAAVGMRPAAELRGLPAP